ncbi:MAG: hypothetical protein Q8P49_04450 [Candidatus Liptonbacteria bacterium]|nr:hypothetical protein [Candidatus Liptonbacteria bacterium]
MCGQTPGTRVRILLAVQKTKTTVWWFLFFLLVGIRTRERGRGLSRTTDIIDKKSAPCYLAYQQGIAKEAKIMVERWRGHGICIGKIHGITINAKDKVGSRKGFDLIIYHVTKPDDTRGFLPSVRLGNSCVENGLRVVPGMDDAAYEGAEQEGLELLNKHTRA